MILAYDSLRYLENNEIKKVIELLRRIIMRRVKGTTTVIAISMFLFVAMMAPVYAESTTSTRSEIEALKVSIATLEATVAAQNTLIVTLTEAVEALQGDVSNNTSVIWALYEKDSLQDGKITYLQNTGNDINTDLTNLQNDLESLATSPIFDLGGFISVIDYPEFINGLIGPHVIFEGVNVHVRNISHSTDGYPDGLGNLVVGYNEEPENMQEWLRSGSHNLIVGPKHTYTGYGSFIAGSGNGTTFDGPYATVTGGQNNQATGYASTVSGGFSNNAGNDFSTVSGGELNRAIYDYSTVSGGFNQETAKNNDHLP
jgi:uncharacterized coiled-coil protein SlyX